jgi:hypothetical protein
MKNEMISVVISVLNGGATLSACLESVVKQDYGSMEIIIIDGGSLDNTLDIIHKYSRHIHYIISEPDTGIYNAWNKALRIVRGDWVCFIGSDDTFASRDSLRLLSFIAVYPDINYVSGRMVLTNSYGDQLRIVGKPFISQELSKGMKFAHPGSLHHITLFRDHGPFNEHYKIAGDFEFFLRCNRSIRAAFTPLTVVNMGVGGLSSTQQTRVISEGYRALRDAPDFGAFIGMRFFIVAIIKSVLRKVLSSVASLPLIFKKLG